MTMRILERILPMAVQDPCLSWVKGDDDLCLAVFYRAAVKHEFGMPPEPVAVFKRGPECEFLKFPDGSLYCTSGGDPEVWLFASDFLAENFDKLSEQEKEFLQ